MKPKSPLFTVHLLNALGLEKAAYLRDSFDELAERVDVCVGDAPESQRCLAITRTKLEEACFYAKKALAQNPVNQQVEP